MLLVALNPLLLQRLLNQVDVFLWHHAVAETSVQDHLRGFDWD